MTHRVIATNTGNFMLLELQNATKQCPMQCGLERKYCLRKRNNHVFMGKLSYPASCHRLTSWTKRFTFYGVNVE